MNWEDFTDRWSVRINRFKSYWFPHRVYRLIHHNITDNEAPQFEGPAWAKPRFLRRWSA